MNEKIIKIHELLEQVNDRLVMKFFDLNSEKHLDTKIEVLTKLRDGVPPSDIPEYYSILELYPKDDQIWD